MPRPLILVTNDDGWDAPGLAALTALAAELGEVCVVAPKEQHSYSGHRISIDRPLLLEETGSRQFTLTGTPADCVRVALTELFPETSLVLAGINRGGNLGADIYISGTVAAAREAALLGRPSIAISQYVRRDRQLDWEWSRRMAGPVVAQLMAESAAGKSYWNINLPHTETGSEARPVRCDPDDQPLDVRFRRERNEFHYSGDYRDRPRTPGRDVQHCFDGSITVSRLLL